MRIILIYFECLFSSLVELFGKDEEVWPWWRKCVKGEGLGHLPLSYFSFFSLLFLLLSTSFSRSLPYPSLLLCLLPAHQYINLWVTFPALCMCFLPTMMIINWLSKIVSKLPRKCLIGLVMVSSHRNRTVTKTYALYSLHKFLCISICTQMCIYKHILMSHLRVLGTSSPFITEYFSIYFPKANYTV